MNSATNCSPDDLLAAIDDMFAADDQAIVDEAHEEALAFGVLRGRVAPAMRAEMRASLTPQGVRMFEKDAAFAAFVLPRKRHGRLSVRQERHHGT